MEDAEKCDRVLLHVEDDGPLRAAEEGKGCRGGEQIEASLYSEL